MSLEFDPVHPKGRLNLRSVRRPSGTLGYFRLSLRDNLSDRSEILLKLGDTATPRLNAGMDACQVENTCKLRAGIATNNQHSEFHDLIAYRLAGQCVLRGKVAPQLVPDCPPTVIVATR
jgi:hypothetical protein